MPINYPQATAWLSDADELFFGGSAGGSKTWTLLGLALTAHTRTLILRQEATQLQQIKDDLMQLKGSLDHWRSIGYGGVLETVDGRKIEISGCESLQAAEKYRGRAHDLKSFDEATGFSESTYRFVSAWCRTSDPTQRCRVVATGNPPTRPEEEWVIRYWAPWLDSQHPNPAEPGELRYFATLDGKDVELEGPGEFKHKNELIKPRSRTFIPARLEDNPILEATGYRAALQGLPEPLRSQLLYGDMGAGRQDDEWQLIPTKFLRDSMRRWRDDGRGDKRMDCAALDVAMGGADRLCLAKRYGNWIDKLNVWPGSSVTTGEEIKNTVLAKLESMHMPLLVDVLATPGGSAVTSFRTVKGLTVWAINFGEGSDYKDVTGRLKMSNKRAESFWRLREALDPARGDKALILPDDAELLTELSAIRWKPLGGRVQLEKKEDIAKRIGRSIDKADACAMTMLADSNRNNGWIPVSSAPAPAAVKPAGYDINRGSGGGISYGSMASSDDRSSFMGMGR